MPKPITFGELEFNLVADMENTVGAPDPEDPFRILILGDFSGRTNRGTAPSGDSWANQRPIRVDRDNFDAVMAKLGIGLTLPVPGKATPLVSLRFSGLEEFHPDHLYERLDVFQALKDTRKSLEDPATFAAVAGCLKGAGSHADATALPSKSENAAAEKTVPVSGDLLDQIISQTPPEQGKSSAGLPPSEWRSFLQEIVKPHLVSGPHPRQVEMMASVDAAAGELMRMILHQPDFMALEAAWKGLHFLASRLETDALLKLYLLDISKAELAADLEGAENLRSTCLYRLLVEQSIGTPGAEPWAVLIGNYRFEKCHEDIDFLGRMAKIAKASGAPFIASASDKMVCRASLAKTPDPDDWGQSDSPEAAHAWQALRELPEAAYLGLVLPRFLLRLPYGADTEPVDAFDFEEMPASLDHEDCLWGNSAFTCALLLGQAFSRNGWRLRPADQLEVNNLPLYLRKDDAESKLMPCAETLLTQHAAETILDSGLMPLLSFLNQDSVRLARFQAIAAPPCRLAGRWEG
jgi:type VI secretion system protein ImpC